MKNNLQEELKDKLRVAYKISDILKRAGRDDLMEFVKKEIEELKKEINKSTKKIRPDVGDWYWSTNLWGSVQYRWEQNCDTCRIRWNAGYGFFTREEAQKELAIRQAKQRIKDYIILNDMEFEPDWKDIDQPKYYIFFNHGGMELYIYEAMGDQEPFNIVFEYREKAEQCMQDCKEDWLIIFGVWEYQSER
jgi:hypothetical protein